MRDVLRRELAQSLTASALGIDPLGPSIAVLLSLLTLLLAAFGERCRQLIQIRGPEPYAFLAVEEVFDAFVQARPRSFNEAAGIHRRKRPANDTHSTVRHWRFNEAAGIHRRKRWDGPKRSRNPTDASMRPPEFTGGNLDAWTSGLTRQEGFNEAAGIHRRKQRSGVASTTLCNWCFNEAAGIHRRKLSLFPVPRRAVAASMRPPEFTGGNVGTGRRRRRSGSCFNEAAGIHRRKPGAGHPVGRVQYASMRPPEFTGGNTCSRRSQSGTRSWLQ